MKPLQLSILLPILVSALFTPFETCATNLPPSDAEEDASKGEAGENRDPMALNYHLMHPGGPSGPGDPNAAFHLDGTYHLHYIFKPEGTGYSACRYAHVTSPDLLHWTWQETKLRPSFTGHGMFSGTGFMTKEGKPAVIYHGQGSGRNWIAIAKNRDLSAWEKPYPVEVRNPDGSEADMRHWDPDCFRVGDTYYAISGGKNPPLFKSKDLKNWTLVGDFLKQEPPDVAKGEDISCANFFPIGDRWMLLCISHPFGCRYYLGDWDATAEQFVPESHGRMSFEENDDADNRRAGQIFAPESVRTADGRRVMWAWLRKGNPRGTVQTLPRELSLGRDGTLRIGPARELESLRYDPDVFEDVTVQGEDRWNGGFARTRVTELNGDAFEIRAVVSREQAERKRFGLRLFASDDRTGLPITIRPERGTIQVGETAAPFAVADLPPDEDVELRVFIDKYIVEVFVNDRQAVIESDMEYTVGRGLDAYTWGAPTTFRSIEIWRMNPSNQGYLEAQKSLAY